MYALLLYCIKGNGQQLFGGQDPSNMFNRIPPFYQCTWLMRVQIHIFNQCKVTYSFCTIAAFINTDDLPASFNDLNIRLDRSIVHFAIHLKLDGEIISCSHSLIVFTLEHCANNLAMVKWPLFLPTSMLGQYCNFSISQCGRLCPNSLQGANNINVCLHFFLNIPVCIKNHLSSSHPALYSYTSRNVAHLWRTVIFNDQTWNSNEHSGYQTVLTQAQEEWMKTSQPRFLLSNLACVLAMSIFGNENKTENSIWLPAGTHPLMWFL